MKKLTLSIAIIILCGCLGMPKAVQPVNEFELDRYLGKWFEIARLDHSFEKGLTNVTAEYRMREDGGVSVVNSGFSAKENKWREAEGKAYFVNSESEGHLKVSFFGPFYGSYIIFELDKEDYQYSFISGPNKSYLWLLSRTPNVKAELLKRFMSKATKLGFDTQKLILVEHDKS